MHRVESLMFTGVIPGKRFLGDYFPTEPLEEWCHAGRET